MKFAVCIISLGYTRLAGITLYDSDTREFVETTTAVAKQLISKGMVKGVLWKKDGFVPDPEFNMQDILVKSGVGKYRPLLKEVPGAPVFSTYTVVRILNTNKGKLYEVISNKCQRVKLAEDKLIKLNEIGNVAGVFISDNEVKVCDGVVIQERNYPDDVILDSGSVTPELPVNVSNNEVEVEEQPVEKNSLDDIFEQLGNGSEDKVENNVEVEEAVEAEQVEEQTEGKSKDTKKTAYSRKKK